MKLSPSPSDVKMLTFQESSPVVQSVKPPPGPRNADHCLAIRSASEMTMGQSPKPNLPLRSRTIGEAPPVRRSTPVQKSGSAGQLLASVMTKSELNDIRCATLPSNSPGRKQKKQSNSVSEQVS